MCLAEIYSAWQRRFEGLFRNYHGAAFAIWTPGWRWKSSSAADPEFTFLFKDPASLEKLFSATEASLGEAFIRGDIDIEGDLFKALSLSEYLFSQPMSLSTATLKRVDEALSEALNMLLRGRPHSRRRDHVAIAYHYDRPPQFFRPWLGSTMVYSCAYFRNPRDDIDTAQINKLDLICRKLELERGDSFLDIGCGWGGLAMHAASQYGAQARGITLSKEQARYAAARLAPRKLNGKCFIEERDYRELLELPQRFDKIASVGMFEHVGKKNLERYFRIAWDLLNPNGCFLNHGIGRAYNSQPTRNSFISRYVFPDGELVPLHQTIECAEAAGFEVRDVENLREHYAQTLRLWVAMLRKNASTLLTHVQESTYRIWLLYMSGSAVAFDRGDINVNQVLLRKRERTSGALPSTREHWYRNTYEQKVLKRA